MSAEDFQTRKMKLAGWEMQLTSYWLNGRYVAEVEMESLGMTIARALSDRREESEDEAIEKAATRLESSCRGGAELMVGG